MGPESDQNRDPQGIGVQSFASAGTTPVGPESDQNRDPQGIGVQSFASAGNIHADYEAMLWSLDLRLS